MFFRRLTPLLLTLAAALAAAAPASPSGGTSIAAAPLAPSGAKLTGDTVSDATTQGGEGIGFDSGCWHDHEFWRLELGAGDEVTFSGGGIDPGTNFELGLFPPGTTDSTIAKAHSAKNGFPKRRSVVYDAVVPGTYVLVLGPNCYDGVDGPFAVTVAVDRGAAPVRTAVGFPARVPANGPVIVSVKAPGSVAVTDPKLVLKLYGTWKDAAGSATSHLLGTATPRNGSASFGVHLPTALKGAKIQLRLLGGGTGYTPVKSAPVVRTVS